MVQLKAVLAQNIIAVKRVRWTVFATTSVFIVGMVGTQQLEEGLPGVITGPLEAYKSR